MGLDQILQWTPLANTSRHGLTAFSVEATDGFLTSPILPVKVKTAKFPTVSVSANKPNASETDLLHKGDGQFTISRADGDINSPLTVHFTLSGSANFTADYSLNVNGTDVTNTVTIPMGKTSVVVNLVPVDDARGEGTENAILTLSTDSQYTPSASLTKSHATVAIADNEPVISIVANKPSASEINDGVSKGIGQFTIARTTNDTGAAVTVQYVVEGSATQGNDLYLQSQRHNRDQSSDHSTRCKIGRSQRHPCQ